MKTHVLTLALSLLLVGSVGAQTFTIDWTKPDTVKGLPTDFQLKREGSVRNLNMTGKELYFSYDISLLGLDHTAQLCMTMCWALYPGPGDNPYERIGQVLAPNGTLPIYVDIAPNGSIDNSVIKVSLFDKSDKAEVLNFTTTFVVSNTSSIRDAAEIGLTTGPLPASDVLVVRGDALHTISTLGLYDTSGNLVRSFGVSGSSVASLPLSGLATGAYRLIMTQTNGEMVSTPVVIAH
ncbi:MAG: T9SS type A sorting domain-containing protein [Candidatus Kapabacteria bacterium]|nr:T9SS type A sorting domain-containing protein [Candidatus Kapabacteria bacterium]